MGDRLATIDMGRKVGGAAVPLSVGGVGSPCDIMSPTIHQRYRQTDRQDTVTVAQGEPLHVMVAQKLFQLSHRFC